MSRPLHWTAAGLLALVAVVAVEPAPARAQYSSGYYSSRPGYSAGFSSSYGRYGSPLYYRNSNWGYSSGYFNGGYSNSYYGYYYRNGGYATGYGGNYGRGYYGYGRHYHHRGW